MKGEQMSELTVKRTNTLMVKWAKLPLTGMSQDYMVEIVELLEG